MKTFALGLLTSAVIAVFCTLLALGVCWLAGVTLGQDGREVIALASLVLGLFAGVPVAIEVST